MTGLTYDTGVLLAAERNDRRMWVMHRRALERRLAPTVPAGVLVEGWRGSAEVARLLRGCSVEPLDERHARSSGLLRGRCTAPVEAVDAMVAESALRRGDAVVTSNRAHVLALAEAADRRLAVIDV
jgi:predicted nucleic acid-binding protein